MLREYGKQLYLLWFFADALIVAGVFVALALNPALQAPSFAAAGDRVTLAFLGVVATVTWPVAMGRAGLYDSQRRRPLSEVILRLLTAGAIAMATLSAFAFTLNAPLAPVFPLALASLLFFFQAGMRIPTFAVLHALRRGGRNFRNILIVGSGPRARDAARMVETNPEWGFRILGYLDDGEGSFDPAVPQEEIFKFVDLPNILRDEIVDEVLVACPRSMLDSLEPVVGECATIGVPVTLLTDLFGGTLPPPRAGRFGARDTASFAPVHHSEIDLAVKRVVDIAGAVVGLVLSAPVLALAALAIKATSRGPVLFRQLRSGLNGRRFEIAKLRTMYIDAEERKAEVMHLNEMGGPVFKITHDPRVTPVGRVLRKLSIDELPQFWNVLLGDMSLVGPRPLPVEECLQIAPTGRRRQSMRPGLTCLWQVSGRNDVDFDEWMELDLEYIDKWSLARDARIIAQTVPTVLLGKGAK